MDSTPLEKNGSTRKKSGTAVLGLEPKLFWKFFLDISQIPHGSKNEKELRTWIGEFCKSQNLNDIEVDEIGNMVIHNIPASSEKFKNVPKTILQGHLDMVTEKNEGKIHNFKTDAIELVRDGEFIRANGTTLGADDAHGIAVIMSILSERDSFDHGPLEVLFTVQEEIGMIGTKLLKPKFVDGKYLFNLDCTGFGKIFIGCAGGQKILLRKSCRSRKIEGDCVSFFVNLKGLLGGHSGKDIHRKRGNALKLMAKFIRFLEKSGINPQVSSIDGGKALNGISRSCSCVISIDKEFEKSFEKAVKAFLGTEIAQEFSRRKSGDLQIEFEKIPTRKIAISFDCVDNLLKLIESLFHGVLSMYDPKIFPGTVQSSGNFAKVETDIENGQFVLGSLMRSSEVSELGILRDKTKKSAENLGFSVQVGKAGLPWPPDPDSQIVECARLAFRKLNKGENPDVKVVHAGLETPILQSKSKNKNLQAIAFGPTIIDQHSPTERIEIKSVGKHYNLVKEILSQICVIEGKSKKKI